MALHETEPSQRDLIGRCTLAPNPCTTTPCLPGVAYALECEAALYYLTLAGRWSAQARSYAGYAAQLGDEIEVTGLVSRHTDIFGKPFYTVEVRSARPVSIHS